MSNADTPGDGDFASLIKEKLKQTEARGVAARKNNFALDFLAVEQLTPGSAPFGAELTEEIASLRNAPPLSDDELERQALADGRADGDIDAEPEQQETPGVAPLERDGEIDVPAFDYLNSGLIALEVAALSEELEEEIAAARDAPLSDEELERQALESGGAGSI